MIVEAGYDLATLMFEGRFTSGAVRVLSLDADFRVVECRAAEGSPEPDLSSISLEAVDDAVPRHDEEHDVETRYAVRFVALGFEVPKVDGYLEGLDWDRHRAIKERFGRRGIELLGVYVSDGDMWASSGPMGTFSTYIGAEEYPRMLIIRGPHPFLTCTCPVCEPERERIDRARAATAAHEGA